MKKPPAFIEHLHEVFESFGPITSRAMFGGYGIYHDGLMFGLVADEVLYLKADKESIPLFENEGLGPFLYEKNGKAMPMSYYQAPDEIYDDLDVAKHWARIGFDAALRNRKPKKQSKSQFKSKKGK